jgi:hypothetical protein
VKRTQGRMEHAASDGAHGKSGYDRLSRAHKIGGAAGSEGRRVAVSKQLL